MIELEIRLTTATLGVLGLFPADLLFSKNRTRKRRLHGATFEKNNSHIKIRNTIPEIILIMLLAFAVWAILIYALGFYHEIGHALIALIFGVRIIEITPAQVVTEPIDNSLVLLIVRSAGGFFQALLPMLIFICVDLISRKYIFDFVKKYRLMLLIVISSELALLTHSIYGFANGVVEGFLPEFYAANHNNLLLWSLLFLLFAVIVSVWLHKRWRMAWSASAWKFLNARAHAFSNQKAEIKYSSNVFGEI